LRYPETHRIIPHLLIILGWIIWAIIALLALSWAFGLRTYTRKGMSVPTAMAVQTLFLWVIVLFFFFFHFSKLHILWAAPVCFIASIYLTTGRRVPILTPLIMWFTGLCLEIVLLGLKRPAE
jgi:hypothetical protein